MRKILITGSAIAVFLGFVACKKSDSKSNARTVENFSGSYAITALTGNFGGLSINIYDTLPACDKDNLIQLNTNMTAAFVDAGTKCAPPSDSSGTWSLSSNTDTLYLAGSAGFIKSWDGSVLVLASSENISGIPIPIAVTTTLTKK